MLLIKLFTSQQNSTGLWTMYVGGPIASKKHLVMAVKESIRLYGCEIWADARRTERYPKRMVSVQRQGAFSVASSYRTVPELSLIHI